MALLSAPLSDLEPSAVDPEVRGSGGWNDERNWTLAGWTLLGPWLPC